MRRCQYVVIAVDGHESTCSSQFKNVAARRCRHSEERDGNIPVSRLILSHCSSDPGFEKSRVRSISPKFMLSLHISSSVTPGEDSRFQRPGSVMRKSEKTTLGTTTFSLSSFRSSSVSSWPSHVQGAPT